MFTIPLVAASGGKPSGTVRIAALSSFGMTLLFVMLSVFPIVQEQNRGLFTIRILGLVAGVQFAGVASIVTSRERVRPQPAETLLVPASRIPRGRERRL